MARPLRIHIPGMIYHVMSRGNAKQVIFTDDHDYVRYLQLLARATERFGVRCLSYCLLGNHLHLVLQPDAIPISRMMQQLNSAFAQWFNRRHGRVGHVLQGRYKAVLVESPVSVLNVLRYVAMNPVAAGRVCSPGDWRWSSFRATAGLEPVPKFLDAEQVWRTFDMLDRRTAQRRFAEFVGQVPDTPLPERALIIGSDAFIKQFRPMLLPHRNVDAFVRAERFAARPTLSELFQDVTTRQSLAVAARIAFAEHAYTLREIGIQVERSAAAVWSWINRSSDGPASSAIF